MLEKGDVTSFRLTMSTGFFSGKAKVFAPDRSSGLLASFKGVVVGAGDERRGFGTGYWEQNGVVVSVPVRFYISE